MRGRAALLLALIAIGAVATGCGGDEEKSETVPSTPELTVPGGDTATVEDSTTGTDTDSDTTGTDGGTGQSDGGAAAPVTPAPAPAPTPQAPQNGGAKPQPQQTPTQQQGNNGGADFCAANPGAC